MRPVRPLLAGIAACVLAACSGGGMTPGQPGSKPSLPMPIGVDPASVRPAPMIRTTILPSSAMTSPGRNADTTIVPPFWIQLPGRAIEVQAAADGSLWALSDQPSGPDKNIWHYQGGTWTNISGLAAHIAVAPNGTLYAVNAGGGVWRYDGPGWTALGGGAATIAAVADNSIYVTEPTGGADGTIWHDVAGTWTQVPGLGVSLVGGLDTTGHTIPGGTLDPGGLYVVNAAGQIFYLNTDTSYAQVPGAAAGLASWPGGVLVFGDPGGSFHPLYYYDLDSPGWSSQSGSGGQMSSNGGNLFVAGTNGRIYKTSLTVAVNPLDVSVPSLSIVGTGATFAQTFHVTESGYAGTFTETDTCSGIATLAPPAGGSGPDLAVTATGIAAGSCSATYGDANTQSVTIDITVTTGSITVT